MNLLRQSPIANRQKVKRIFLSLLLLLFSSSLIQAQAISPSGITNSGDIVNSGNIINSGKIGINQSIPSARLHISDDLQRLN